MDDQDRRDPSIRPGNGRGTSLPRRSRPAVAGDRPALRPPDAGDQEWTIDPGAADRYLRSRETEMQGSAGHDLGGEGLSDSGAQDGGLRREGRPRRDRDRQGTTATPRGRSISSDDLAADIEEIDLAPPDRPDRRSARMRTTGESTGRRARDASRRLPSTRTPAVRLPPAFQGSTLLGDRLALIFAGATVFSALLMWVTISSRIGALPDVITVRRGAEGIPTRFDAPSSLWQMPLIATFATLMNAMVAWVTHRGDRFASRMILGLTMVIHLLVWVAVVQFVW